MIILLLIIIVIGIVMIVVVVVEVAALPIAATVRSPAYGRLCREIRRAWSLYHSISYNVYVLLCTTHSILHVLCIYH